MARATLYYHVYVGTSPDRADALASFSDSEDAAYLIGALLAADIGGPMRMMVLASDQTRPVAEMHVPEWPTTEQ